MISKARMNAVVNQMDVLEATRRTFLAAKAAFLNCDDITSDSATELMEKLFAARDTMIEQAFQFAQLSPKSSAKYIETFKMLRDRAKTSPSIREKLVNAILELELIKGED